MRSLLAAFLLAGLVSAARATEPPGRLIDAPEDYTYGCTEAEARSVPFGELQRDPRAFLRHCVRITGIIPVGREVYADLFDSYRHMTQLIASMPEGIGIGLYGSKKSVVEWTERGEVEIIGRAFSCEEIAREAEQAQAEKFADSTAPRMPVMLTGYCHYYGNAIIYVARQRVLRHGPLRLTGAEAARAIGDLEDLSPAHELYSEVWKRVTRWFDAVRRESTPEHDDFMADCGKLPASTPEAAADIRACRKLKQDQLASLGRSTLPPTRYYLRTTKTHYSSRGDYAAFGCVCREASCEGRWPIHSIDMGSSTWPYFCAHVTREGGSYKVY